MPTDPSTDARFFDFDEWYAEAQGETIPFRLLGEVWQLPADIEATKILRIQRLEQAVTQASVTGKLPDGFEQVLEDLSYEKLCREMVGDEIVDAWLGKGIRIKMMQAVSRRLYAIYTGTDADTATGQAATPKGEAKPRTKAGRRTAAKKTTAARRKPATKSTRSTSSS